MKIITSWYKVPILDCIRELNNYCIEIVTGEILLCAVYKGSDFYMLGFCKEDVELNCFEKPLLFSSQGFDDYSECQALCKDIKTVNEDFNIFLKIDGGDVIICQEFTEHLNNKILNLFLNGSLILNY